MTKQQQLQQRYQPQRPNAIVHYLPSQQYKVKDAAVAATSASSDIAMNNNTSRRFIHATTPKASLRREVGRGHAAAGRGSSSNNNTSFGSFLLMPTTKEETNRTFLGSSSSSSSNNRKTTTVHTCSDSGSRRKSCSSSSNTSQYNKKDSLSFHTAGSTTSNTAKSTTARSMCSSDECSSTNYTEDSGDTYFQITYHPGGYQAATTTTPGEKGQRPGDGTAVVVSPSPARPTRRSRRNKKMEKNLSNESMTDAQPRLLQGHQYDLQSEQFEDMDIVQILPDIVVNNNVGGDDDDDEDETLDGSIEVSYKNSSKYTDGSVEDAAPPSQDIIDTFDDSIEMSIRDASPMRSMYGIFRREEEAATTTTTSDDIVTDIPKPTRVSKSRIVMVPKIAFPTSSKTTTWKPHSVPFKTTKEQGSHPDSTGTKQHALYSSNPSSDGDAEINSNNDGNSTYGCGNVEVEMELQGHTSKLKSSQKDKFVPGDHLTTATEKHYSRTLRPAESVKKALKSMTRLMNIRRYQQGQKSKILGQGIQILVDVDDDDCNTVEVLTDRLRPIPMTEPSEKKRLENGNSMSDDNQYFPINHGRIDAADVSSSELTRLASSEFVSKENDSTTNSNRKISDGSSAFGDDRFTSQVETFNGTESGENSFQRFGGNQSVKGEKKMKEKSARLGGRSKIVKFSKDDEIAEATNINTKFTTKNMVLSPSPRDNPYFIRPNQLLVTPDVSENSIEIKRQPIKGTRTHLDKGKGSCQVVQGLPLNGKWKECSSTSTKSMTSEETYLLTVKIHGVTGIVSDHYNRSDVRLGDTDAASPPRVIVGISEQGANTVEDLTSFSEDLIFPSYERKCSVIGVGNYDSRRNRGGKSHVATWSASHASQTSGSELKIILSDVRRIDGNDSLSPYLPIVFDLTIALGPFGSKSGRQSFAIPVGAAKLKVSNGDIRGGENRRLDIPVLSLEQSKELSRLASESRSSSSDAFGVHVIELGVNETRVSSKSGRQKLQRASDSTSKFLSSTIFSSFHSTWGIDGGDDSIIRVEYFVEKVNGDTEGTSMEKIKRQTRESAARAIESSPPSPPWIEFNKAPAPGSVRYIMEDTASFCTVDSKVVESIKSAYQADRRDVEGNRRIAYSSPLGFHQTAETDAVANDNVPASRQPESYGDLDSSFFSCGVLQSNQQYPVQDQVIGHSIMKPAETFFEPSTCCFSYAKGNEKGDSSLSDTSLLLVRSKTGKESFSQSSFSEVSKVASLLSSMDDEESFFRNSYSFASQNPREGISVCRSGSRILGMGRKGDKNKAQEDVKHLLTETTGAVKNFVADNFGKWAVTRAEELFPSDATIAEETLPDEDITSVGDATLEAFMNGRLRMRSVDDRKSKYSNDDGTLAMTSTYDSGSTKDSSLELRNKSIDARGRSSIPPLYNKYTPQQRPYAHHDFQSHIEDKSLAGATNDTFTVGSGSILSRDCSSMNKTMTTMDTKTETWTKDEHDDTTLNGGSQEESLTGQSVVEAIAEVISNYTSCGSIMMMSNAERKQKKSHEITEQVPDTIFNHAEDAVDLNSLGELTVGTFETLEVIEKKYKAEIPVVEASTKKGSAVSPSPSKSSSYLTSK